MDRYFVDTNYFLRLLLKDNEKQFKEAYSLFQKAIHQEVKLFTSIIVFFEIYWVLLSFYKHNKQKCVYYLEKILKMRFIEIERREILEAALDLFKKDLPDLEDCYNIALASNLGILKFASFDKGLKKMIVKLKWK